MITKIIKYSTPTCMPCKQQSIILEKVLPNFPEICLEEINIQTIDRSVLVDRLIQAVPTLLFYNENNEEVYRSVGLLKEMDLIKCLKEH